MAKFGYIGLGGRGIGMLKNLLECFKEQIEIVAVCDLMEERIEDARKAFEENSVEMPFSTTDEDVPVDGLAVEETTGLHPTDPHIAVNNNADKRPFVVFFIF